MSFKRPSIPAKQAAFLAGLSILMLDYLERDGVFERDEVRADEDARSRKKGRHRDYSFRDVVVLRAISRLLEKGISVRRLKAALIEFARDTKFECDRKRMRYDQAPVQYLVTDGRQLYFKRDGGSVTSILEAGQQAFLFVLDVSEARETVMSLEGPKKKVAK